MYVVDGNLHPHRVGSYTKESTRALGSLFMKAAGLTHRRSWVQIPLCEVWLKLNGQNAVKIDRHIDGCVHFYPHRNSFKLSTIVEIEVNGLNCQQVLTHIVQGCNKRQQSPKKSGKGGQKMGGGSQNRPFIFPSRPAEFPLGTNIGGRWTGEEVYYSTVGPARSSSPARSPSTVSHRSCQPMLPPLSPPPVEPGSPAQAPPAWE